MTIFGFKMNFFHNIFNEYEQRLACLHVGDQTCSSYCLLKRKRPNNIVIT